MLWPKIVKHSHFVGTVMYLRRGLSGATGFKMFSVGKYKRFAFNSTYL